VPHPSIFSRAFVEFARSELPTRMHAALIKRTLHDRIVGHISRDSTAIEAREKPMKVAAPEKPKRKRGRPRKGEVVEKEPRRLERQAAGMSLSEMLSDLPRHCAVGTKRNAKGHTESWIGLATRCMSMLPMGTSRSPPARVSVSDGLIAALIFFVLQGLVVGIQLAIDRTLVATAGMIWTAFCSAGAVTYGLMRLVYWRSGAAGVPRMFNAGAGRALMWGAVGGVLAALSGVIYLQTIIWFDLFHETRQAMKLPDTVLTMVVAAIVIVAAPVFEEFIFRGLIFGGLSRSLGLPSAVTASAAIFAIVHPAVSVIPVFVLGLCTALIYERTRMLAAPIVVHMVYNAAVLGFQWTAAG
jgi:membrane protease YdiL (CAAX protease family)